MRVQKRQSSRKMAAWTAIDRKRGHIRMKQSSYTALVRIDLWRTDPQRLRLHSPAASASRSSIVRGGGGGGGTRIPRSWCRLPRRGGTASVCREKTAEDTFVAMSWALFGRPTAEVKQKLVRSFYSLVCKQRRGINPPKQAADTKQQDIKRRLVAPENFRSKKILNIRTSSSRYNDFKELL